MDDGSKEVCCIEKANKDEMFRYRIKKIGVEDLIFIDYVSSGKNWATSNDKVSVWVNPHNFSALQHLTVDGCK